MKAFFLLAFCLAISLMTRPQAYIFQKPDYKKIKSAIEDKHADTYYPKLFERYQNSDTGLSREDFKMLYYGYFYRSGYSVFDRDPYADSLKPILAKEEYGLADFDAMIKYETLDLKAEPFSLRSLNILAFALEKKDQTAESESVIFKLRNLVELILSTGDGRTDTTGLHILSVDDEYEMLHLMGYDFGGMQSLTKGGCDYLKVKPNKDSVAGVYFDANMILAAESKALRGK
ncbi:MAG TPA: DUF4919 domain-containing protein [Puia sp.]|nr:DUF4919 domain-containing protein [Puia sp.]